MRFSNFFIAAMAVSISALNSIAAESPDIFIGPFSHWLNVKSAPYNAVGNGSTDDRGALQSALDAVKSAGGNRVVYLPAGTYKISNTLNVGPGCTGFSILGAHPDSVCIQWTGASGGTMFNIVSSSHVRIGRITWDGMNSARRGIFHSWANYANYFPHSGEHHDGVYQNFTGPAIQGGDANATTGQSTWPEGSVTRCKFYRCGSGILVLDWNSADIWARHCLFEACGTGFNMSNGEGGAYNCVFRGSTTADINHGTQGCFVRHCYSSNSRAFYTSGSGMDGYAVNIEGNVIINPTAANCITATNVGPHGIFDNVFRVTSTQLPVMYLNGSSRGNFLINNTISAGTVTTVIRNSSSTTNPVGRVIDTRIVDPSTISTIEPILPSTPRRFSGTVIEPTALTGAAIQTAILSAATAYGTSNTPQLVYLKAGNYSVASTIVIPKSIPIYLIGEGGSVGPITRLNWSGTGAGPVLRLAGPSKATLSSFYIAGARAAQGILIENADQPNGRVLMYHCDAFVGEGSSDYAVLADSLDYTNIEAWSYMMACDNNSSIRVVGGPLTAAGQASATSCVNVWGCNVMNGPVNGSFWSIENGGKLMVCDNWGEANPRGPYINFTSANSGTFTTQGYKIQYHTNGNGTSPTMIFNGFTGKATVFGLVMMNSVVSIAGSNPLQNVMYAAVDFGHQNNYGSSYSITATQGKTAIINCTRDKPVGNDGDFPHVGNYQISDDGNSINDEAWIRDMMAQAQSNHPSWDLPSTPDNTTDVKMWRLYFNACKKALQVKACPTCPVGVVPSVKPTAKLNTAYNAMKILPGAQIDLPDNAKYITVFNLQGRTLYRASIIKSMDLKQAINYLHDLQNTGAVMVKVE